MAFSKEEFMKDYKLNGEFDLVSQLPHLRRLSDVYLEKCRVSKHWMDYVKAHGILNSCKVRTCEDDVEQRHAVETSIYNLEKEWCQHKGLLPMENFKTWKALTNRHKSKLEEIRVSAENNFEKALKTFDADIDMSRTFSDTNDEVLQGFAASVNNYSKACTGDMIDFAKLLCVDSQSIIGVPPCNYVVVAMGSVARDEATPYSDLEYGFLIDNSDQKEYFFTLAIDTYFRIGNLGETPLKCFFIEELLEDEELLDDLERKPWFEDKATSGFKFDGFTPNAGNIPTGNGGRSLIVTPQQLLEDVYKVCFDKKVDKTKTGDDSHLLSGVVKIHSYPEDQSDLLDEFLSLRISYDEQNKHDPFVIQRRWKTLKEDVKGYKYSPVVTARTLFKKPGVKTAIFRYPTILAQDLKILLGLHECSSAREIFEELHSRSVISSDIHDNLQFILMAAIWIRTSAYLHGRTQREELAFLPRNTEEEERDRFYLPRTLFIQMNCRLNPIKTQLLQRLNLTSDVGSIELVEGLFSSVTIDKSDFVLRLQLHYACGDSSSGLQYLKSVFGKDIRDFLPEEFVDHIKRQRKPDDQYCDQEFVVVQLTSNMLFREANFEVAAKYFQWLSDRLNALAEESDSDRQFRRNAVVCLGLKSQCLQMLGRHMDAHWSFVEVRVALTRCYKSKDIFEAIWNAFKDFKREELSDSEVEILRWIYVNSQVLFDTIRYHRTKIHLLDKSFKRLTTISNGLEIMQTVVPEEFHPALGYFYLGIAACHDLMFANYDEAEAFLKKAKKHFEKCFGKAAITHENAAAMTVEAVLSIRRGLYDDAIKVSLATLHLLEKLYAKYSHQALQCHQNLATAYFYTGRYAEAEDELAMCDQIFEEFTEISPLHPGSVHMTRAQILCKNGSLQGAKAEIVLALDQFEKALLPKGGNAVNLQPDVADARRVSAEIDIALGETDRARVSLEKTTLALNSSFGEGNLHPNMAEAHHVFAMLEQKVGNIPEAIKRSERSIEIVKAKFGDDSDHPSLLKYNNFLDALLVKICE